MNGTKILILLVAILFSACGNKANQGETVDAPKQEANVPSMSYKDRAVEIATEALAIRKLSYYVMMDIAMNWESFNGQHIIYDKDNKPVKCYSVSEFIRQRELFHLDNNLKTNVNLLNDMDSQLHTMKNIQSDGSASISTLEAVKEQCSQLQGYLLQNDEVQAKSLKEFLDNTTARFDNLDDALKQTGDIVNAAGQKEQAFWETAETSIMKDYREKVLDPYIKIVRPQ